MRNLTQKELAIKSGLTDASIRNYELGNRSPSKEQLQKISEALNCDISTLIYHEPNSIFEIMYIIFDYEKNMKFRPSAGNGEITGLLSNDLDFNNFLIEWNEMRKNTIMEKFLIKSQKTGNYRILRNLEV